YFYIRLQHPVWPLDNLPLPDLIPAGAGTVAVLAAAIAMFFANRRIQRGDVVWMRVALAAAFVLGALAVGALLYDLSRLPFDHTLNAYGSLYYTLVIFLMALLIFGLGQNLFTQIWSWFGRYSAREHVAV